MRAGKKFAKSRIFEEPLVFLNPRLAFRPKSLIRILLPPKQIGQILLS